MGGLGEGDSVSERLGQRELEGQREDGFQMGEGADSDQGGEGSDSGSWGQRKGQFGEQCVHTVYPLQPGRRGAVPVEVAPEQRPGSSLGPASPSQLTDPELIIINEQLGPAPWDLSWQRHSAHQHLPALASQGVAIQGAEVRDSQASYGAGKV